LKNIQKKKTHFEQGKKFVMKKKFHFKYFFIFWKRKIIFVEIPKTQNFSQNLFASFLFSHFGIGNPFLRLKTLQKFLLPK
jgi:hypothetical protein